MAQPAKAKYLNNENLPILWEDDHLLVYKNPAGEIFVERKGVRGCTVRIGTHRDNGLIVTADRAQLSPYAANGLPAFLVSGKS